MMILRALTFLFLLTSAAQAQTQWQYTPMNAKGVECREGGDAGLAIRRAPNGSKRFLLVMQGGGGCYDEKSCSENPKSFSRAEFDDAQDALNTGIFFRSANNPLTQYHQVFIPYCSGDMHAGSADDHFNDEDQHYRGWANTELYFNEILAQFHDELRQPGVEVLLLGESAGGYGAVFNMPRLRAKLRAISPQIKLTLVDESAPLADTSFVTSCFADGWREQWGFASTFLSECPSCNATSNWLTAWNEHMLSRYPDVPEALLAATQDYVVSKFLRDGWPGCDIKPVVTAQRMIDSLANIRARMQRARVQYGASTSTFFVTAPISNLVHIFLTQPYYFLQSARSAYGTQVRLQDWFSGLFERRATDDFGPL